MAKKKAASSRKGASRQGTRLRNDDKPELDYIIANGKPLWARLFNSGVAAWEVESVTVVPAAGSPAFTVVDLDQEDFEQSGRPVLVPNRTKVEGLDALQISWDRGVSTAERVRGKATGKLTITIRPPGPLDNEPVTYEYDDIEVYIDD